MLPQLNAKEFFAPHRFIPMPTEVDFEESAAMVAGLRALQADATLDSRAAGEGYTRLLDIFATNANQKSELTVDVHGSAGAAGGHRCCFDHGNCSSREHWVGYLDPSVKLLRVSSSVENGRDGGVRRGLAFVAGEGNVQHNPPTIRACTVMPSSRLCP